MFGLLTGAAVAQSYSDWGGTLVQGVAPIPFPFTPLSPGQHGVSISSATGLTIPTGARYAVVQASGGPVKYTTDGTTTPTNSVGMTLANGAAVTLSGATVLANFKAISASATLDVEYFK